MDGAEGRFSRPSRGEGLQAAAAAVDQQADDGRRRNAAEKEKHERLAADPVERERIEQTLRNAAKRPHSDAIDALDAESPRVLGGS